MAEIRLERVSKVFANGLVAVNDLSLTVGDGEFLVLVGPSGCGKSTILQLLLRFYDPQQGRVLYDETDVRGVRQTSLHDQVAIVFQDTFVFNTTIRENLRYGRIDATDADIEAAARQAEIHDFILTLPEGYDTVVGERGARLSGGQRQRVAIARALVGDPRILIFDEATSALDYESERIIQQNMQEIAKGRTVFIVAHRLSTVRRTDRIITIDAGRVLEDGSHDDLIKTGGRYASLHRLQAGIHEVR
jgi:subfamily B ATP-binding cassette protein HlyB/CyaB